MASETKSADPRGVYWRAFQRKLGEDFDLAGKALGATGGAAIFAPLASKGVIAFPNLTIGFILCFGLVAIWFGIHLQAKVKSDE
jgi:hypothetical protein